MFATLCALAAALVLLAILLELNVDLSAWRELIARRASDALGHPVAIQGRFELSLGRQFGLHIGTLRLSNSAGFGHADLLTLNDARASFDPIDALRGRLRLRSIAASEGSLHLERGADGRANWTPSSARPTQRSEAEIDIEQLDLRRFSIEFQDRRAATRRSFELDELSGSAPARQPLRLTLRGHADAQTHYTLKLDGGPLALLQAGLQPWPFNFEVSTDGAKLLATGRLDLPQSRAQFEFKAQAEQPAMSAPGLKLALPEIPDAMAAALSGKVDAGPAAVSVSELRGQLGQTELAGDLALALGPGRPKLSGALQLATLDLRPWLAQDPASAVVAARPAFALRSLVPAAFDLQLNISVDRWLGSPVALQGARFELRSDGQTARVPLTATVAGVALAGRLDLHTHEAAPRLALQLGARDFALAALGQELGLANAPQGRLGRLELSLSGSGETLDELLPNLDFALLARDARISDALPKRPQSAGPLSLKLDQLTLGARRGERLRGQATGQLLGQQARLSLRGATLAEMRHEQAAPFELELALQPSQALLRLEGSFGLGTAQRDTTLTFDVRAPSSGALAPFFNLAAASKLPVALSGQLRIAADNITLQRTQLKLGRSDLSLEASLSRGDDGPAPSATLTSRLIDLAELATLRPASKPGDARRAAPVFPSATTLPDIDLALALQRVKLDRSDLADLADLGVTARIRAGRLLPSTLSAKVAGQALSGVIELDPLGEQAELKLELSGAAVDIGALLRGLGAAEAIEGHADAIRIGLSGRGNSVRELAGQADLALELNGGHISVLGAGQRPVTDIRIEQASVDAAAGQPLRAQLVGSLEQMPLRLTLSTGTLADFVRQGRHLPFWLEADAAGAHLQLDGRVALPLGRSGELNLELSGERLDTLTALTRVNLPPWGPWRLRGPIRMTADGYELEQLRLRVGESQLGGRGTLDLSGPRPRLDVRISGRSVQLDDFPTPKIDAQIAANADPDSAVPPSNAMVTLRGKISGLATRTEGLLSAGFLRRFDANIDVVAREVLSGSDRLADGELHLQLKDGRLRMDPAFVNLPGGRMHLSANFDPTGEQIEFAAKAAIERFDYGIIARRMRRTGNVQGLFSLNFELAGKAPSLDSVMRNVNGKLDIAVWPSNLRADVFNLWSVNLVLNLLPLIDPGGQPQVNCVVGRFDLVDGRLSEENLTIDTTRVRVSGSGFADLASEELSFVFRPRAKGFALFRLQTPLRVSGTLNNQRIGIHRGDLIGSTVRSVLSPIWLPIERLLRGPNPRDGADVCTDPLGARGR